MSVSVETVGLMSHVRLAEGFQEKDSVSKREGDEILMTNHSASLHALLPARLSAQCVVTRTPTFRDIARPKSPIDGRKPLVRRRLKEDLIGSDICVHNRSGSGT